MYHVKTVRLLGAAVFSMVCGMLACAGPLAAQQQPEKEKLVGMRLIADREQVRQGEKFRLGVLLDIAEGAHIYWRNPGDAGLAPHIEWELPGGFDAGPLFWPVPQRLEEPGGLVVNAYKGRVLLFSWVQPPFEAERMEVVELAADADWLVCRKVCMQERGRDTLKIAFGSGPARDSDDRELFEHYAALVPPPSASVEGMTVSSGWEGPADSEGRRAAKLVLESVQDDLVFTGSDARWFGYPSLNLESEDIHRAAGESGPRRLVLHLVVSNIDPASSWPEQWGGVLVIEVEIGGGKRRQPLEISLGGPGSTAG